MHFSPSEAEPLQTVDAGRRSFAAALGSTAVVDEYFRAADERAVRSQWIYRYSAVGASLLGALAIAVSIVSTVWPPESEAHALLFAEVILASVAFAVVVIGLLADIKGAWLRERNKAERYKLARYAFLVRPARWTDPESLRVECRSIELGKPNIEEWVKLEPVPLFGPLTSSDPAGTSELVQYYLNERLDDQISFFRRRAEAFERRVKLLRPIPIWLFYLSFLCVALHAGFELFGGHGNTMAVVLPTLVVLGLVFPVASAALRTVILSRELARNSSRYAAKLSSLLELRERLNAVADAVASGSSIDGAEVLASLAGCEYVLESDHREWTRLMLEAEWY